ncbi:SMI1/KNR4 family protein [Chamaesiphon sp. VAR_48_metabat_135_sub]|uniref:SMI1/KNR4 family protein n=1 Tax=Chamaesiphon sp. VAR_48_metabat_135_sub TaxID=2964699 RepID=UPI00286BF33B|nr:SMI1/KNR4 family protein [Chamaesiphon sp. VAR_48_metabat_135_sub]
MAIPKNFWIPPASGYTPTSRGLTEAQLDAIEQQNGFSFPVAYRSLMRQQNGGTLRYCILEESRIEDFCCLSELVRDLVTFEDYIALTCTEDDLATLDLLFEYCHLNRLIIFAINGHEVGCFDYGLRSEIAVIDPQIIFFGDDSEEILHFKIVKTIASFDDFLSQIALPEEVNETTYLGIESSLDFDSMCVYLAEEWQTKFERKNDDFFGWFNFEKYYCGAVPLFLDDQTLKIYAEENNTTFQEVLDWVGTEGRTRSISAILSPNQHRSGTYLYPDNSELTLILEISKPWFPIDRAIEQLCTRLMTLPNISAVQILP